MTPREMLDAAWRECYYELPETGIVLGLDDTPSGAALLALAEDGHALRRLGQRASVREYGRARRAGTPPRRLDALLALLGEGGA